MLAGLRYKFEHLYHSSVISNKLPRLWLWLVCIHTYWNISVQRRILKDGMNNLNTCAGVMGGMVYNFITYRRIVYFLWRNHYINNIHHKLAMNVHSFHKVLRYEKTSL